MKIALCTPTYGDTRAGYTFALCEMIIETLRRRPDMALRTFTVTGPDVAANRARLVERARKWGAERLLWIDADQVFPADALLRLLARDEPFIGCNYARRGAHAPPTAGTKNELVYTTPQKIADDLIETVDYLGLGFCLVSKEAIEAAGTPLFAWTAEASEDVFFCRRMAAAGFPPKVDHALSAELGHIGLKTYSNEDSLRGKNLQDIESARRARAASSTA